MKNSVWLAVRIELFVNRRISHDMARTSDGIYDVGTLTLMVPSTVNFSRAFCPSTIPVVDSDSRAIVGVENATSSSSTHHYRTSIESTDIIIGTTLYCDSDLTIQFFCFVVFLFLFQILYCQSEHAICSVFSLSLFSIATKSPSYAMDTSTSKLLSSIVAVSTLNI